MVGTEVSGIVQVYKPTTYRCKDLPPSSGATWKGKKPSRVELLEKLSLCHSSTDWDQCFL